jgi:cytochrome c oxidase assembly protein subunit 11
MSKPPVPASIARKNRRLAAAVFCVFALMVGLSFASVPLYSVFCKVTGFGGTPQTSGPLPDKVLAREVTVQFNADTAPGIPWNFGADQPDVKIRLGQQSLVSFSAHNMAVLPIGGTAIYNVTPPKIGKYFHKVQCFCFSQQILGPGADAKMPVLFFIDPAMADDPNMDDVNVVTLSYTFYKTDSPELERAQKDFYNKAPAPGRHAEAEGALSGGNASGAAQKRME